VAQRDLDNTDPGRLASLVDLDPTSERMWTPEELGAILRHQLSVPVQFELGEAAPDLFKTLQKNASAQGAKITSYADLLNHPSPPIELLLLLKDFAKAAASHPDSALPSAVAKVLYYLTISVALLRHNRRITSMSDTDLQSSLRWALNLPWVEPPQRALLEQALGRIA
jgi:hypothetical protein